MNRWEQLALEARDGDLRSRFVTCEPTCLNARGPVCRCLCGGRFHGKGRAPYVLPAPEARTA